MARSFFDPAGHAQASEEMTDRLMQAFREHFDPPHTDAEDLLVARAPGRVNLLGDHTDYNGGFVLPATIDRAVYVIARRRADRHVRLHSLNFEETVEYDLHDPPFPSLPNWARYVAGVTQEISALHELPSGFDALIYGNVPLGAGLSSSAALEVAVAVAVDALFDLELDPIETARLCQRVEHTYLGVQCGIMDQMAARIGKAGHALALDCRSLEVEHVPLPGEEARLVIIDSRVSRELASSKYNERRAECDEGVRFFQHFDPKVESLRDVTPALFDEHAAELGEPVRSRCRHVITENERVTRGARLLQKGKLDAFGLLMNASHASLRDDYEVSAPELDLLVETAQGIPGVLGARMTGAGFGGCVVCLATSEAASILYERLPDRYESQFGREPELYTVQHNLEATALQLS